MLFTSNDPSSGSPYDPIAKAQDHILLIIDSDAARAQKLACLLTLAGLRAIVTASTYQAFERFLHEHFVPRAILLGQQEEMKTTLFTRFLQRLNQEFRRETPIIPHSNFYLVDGCLLVADKALSTTVHTVSKANSRILTMIWRVIPSVQISLKSAEHAIVLETLPKLGLYPHVSHNKRSSSANFHSQLKAARQIIPAELWDNLLTDVGLAHFRQEEQWPPIADKYMIQPEHTTCLNRAVLFSHPDQPAQQAYKWAHMVESDVLQKVALIFVLQQAPKVIGQDRTLRAMLNGFMNETNDTRGEKLADWRRLENGSFIFVLYSNIFAYGFMGASQPSCYVWQAAFDRMLQIGKLQKSWQVRELECSCQTHTGHCVFLFIRK